MKSKAILALLLLFCVFLTGLRPNQACGSTANPRRQATTKTMMSSGSQRTWSRSTLSSPKTERWYRI